MRHLRRKPLLVAFFFSVAMPQSFLALGAERLASPPASASSGAAGRFKFYKDTSAPNCAEHVRGTVVIAKPRGKAVLVVSKLPSGKEHYGTIVENATPADFKPGTPFCAQDYDE